MERRLVEGACRLRARRLLPLAIVDWRTQFLRQAASDFKVAELLIFREPGTPLCHALHYLQMAVEKLAKGIATPPGSMEAPPLTHLGAVALLQTLKKGGPRTAVFHRDLSMGNAQRGAYLDSLLPLLQSLEDIAPAIANSRSGVNAEYPWLSPPSTDDGPRVVAPIDYGFTAEFPRQKLKKAFQLVRTILECYPP